MICFNWKEAICIDLSFLHKTSMALVSQQFLFTVSTVSARNAWKHDLSFCVLNSKNIFVCRKYSLSSPRFLCKFASKKLYLCCYLQLYISYTLLENARNTLSKKLFQPQETHNILQKNKQGIFPIIILKVYGSVNSQCANAPATPEHLLCICHLVGPGGGEFLAKISARGWGICQIF